MGTGEFYPGGTLRCTRIPFRGKKFSSRTKDAQKAAQSFHSAEPGDKCRPDGSLVSYADFTFEQKSHAAQLDPKRKLSEGVAFIRPILMTINKNHVLTLIFSKLPIIQSLN